MVGDKAKQVEYFFKKDPRNPVQDSKGRVYPRNIEVDEQVIQDFKFAYFEHDENRQSIDWKYWRKQLEKGEKIPVFFQVDENDRVKHLGLSYLYKLPYTFKVGDYLKSLEPAKKDLAECIFGRIAEMTKNVGAIKGRVHFGHAFVNTIPTFLESRAVTLSEPKASFYPNYIVQDRLPYSTYMDKPKDEGGRTRLAGWKRYPVHSKSVSKLNYIQDNRSTNDNVKTIIQPMETGSEFSFKIHYHNLRPAELGALIQSIELSSANSVYHKLGMAKPLGCGEVSLKILNTEINGKDKEYFLSCFEAVMNDHLHSLGIKDGWIRTAAVKELFAVSTDAHSLPQDTFYSPNGGIAGQNDFQTYKNRKEFLELFSVRTKITIPLRSFYQPTIRQQDDFSQAASSMNQVVQNLQSVHDKYTKALRAEIKALIAAKHPKP
jgi:CRISPR-associated protein (TIGR03986 family)